MAEGKITSKEWNALLLTVQGKSDVQAYRITFPNATKATAYGQACRYFKRIRDKLSQSQELELFDMGRGRVYKQLLKLLDAKTDIFYKGQKVASVPDNITQFKAVELIAKMNGLLNNNKDKDTDGDSEGNTLKIIVDNEKNGSICVTPV